MTENKKEIKEIVNTLKNLDKRSLEYIRRDAQILDAYLSFNMTSDAEGDQIKEMELV